MHVHAREGNHIRDTDCAGLWVEVAVSKAAGAFDERQQFVRYRDARRQCIRKESPLWIFFGPKPNLIAAGEVINYPLGLDSLGHGFVEEILGDR